MGDKRRGRLTSSSDREEAVKLIGEAVENGASLYKACDEIGISKRSYNRWKSGDYTDKRTTCTRPEPANKITESEKEKILEIVNEKEYASKNPNEIVPALADKGIYIASESTFYKVLKEAGELKHRGRQKESISRPISTHKATSPKEVWMWDITYLNGPVKGIFFYLYMIIDLFSRTIVGWEIWEEESAENASVLMKKTYLKEGVGHNENPLVVHSDNGSPMKAATMLATLYNLGITPSRSRPRVSNDNPYIESLFRTLKYRPNFQPKGFSTLEEARQWAMCFVKWYNEEHKHSGIKYVTPMERHTGKDKEILENRIKVYEAAKAKHPERWSGKTRNWSHETEEWLNPERITNEGKKEDQKEKIS